MAANGHRSGASPPAKPRPAVLWAFRGVLLLVSVGATLGCLEMALRIMAAGAERIPPVHALNPDLHPELPRISGMHAM